MTTFRASDDYGPGQTGYYPTQKNASLPPTDGSTGCGFPYCVYYVGTTSILAWALQLGPSKGETANHQLKCEPGKGALILSCFVLSCSCSESPGYSLQSLSHLFLKSSGGSGLAFRPTLALTVVRVGRRQLLVDASAAGLRLQPQLRPMAPLHPQLNARALQ